MKKFIIAVGGLLLSSPILANTSTTEPIVNFGSGTLTDKLLEPIVSVGLKSSEPIIKLLIIISVGLIVLDLSFSGLVALTQEKYTNFVATTVNKVMTYILYIYIMSNWFTGSKIFENYIFKPMFIYIPEYLTGRELDLDKIWYMLMSLPNAIWDAAIYMLNPITFLISGWLILLLILLAIILYIQVMFLFIKIVTSVLHMIMIALFSFITFPLNFFDKLSTRYGGVMLKTYLVLTLQYTVLYILIINISDMSKYLVDLIYSGGLIFNILFSPLLGFIIAGLMFLMVKFTNTALDMIANISNNM